MLKGAILMMSWFDDPRRGTRDLDLLGFGDPSAEPDTGDVSGDPGAECSRRRGVRRRCAPRVNDRGIGTPYFRTKGTPVGMVKVRDGERPIRRSWSGLHSLIGRG
nr:hypothetical protein [Aminobacter lissarensis]